MITYEQGIQTSSTSFVYTASQGAKNTFFYPTCIGSFHCNTDYHIERNNYDSFLLLYIKRGTCSVVTNSTSYSLSTGHLLLLDCYQYHKYFATSNLIFDWVHFDGISARAYYDLLKSKNKLYLHGNSYLEYEALFVQMLQLFINETMNEALFSKYITDILTLMLTDSSPTSTTNTTPLIEHAISYICTNYQSTITLNDLSKRCSLSPYYFTRVFKKETGYTPHEFLILTRINQAKYFLKTTEDSIKSISYHCGFQNSSNFCTSFKTLVGCTPLEYRHTHSNSPTAI